MGTELLKEQYNLMINEQKTKLERLKQKKNLMNQQKNNDFDEPKFDDENDLELDLKNKEDLDKDLFSKFDRIDKLDSSDDDRDDFDLKFTQSKTKPNNKILVKKSQVKPENKAKNESLALDDFEPIRESLSFADKMRELRDENGRLRKSLAEKDYEVNYLKKKLEEEKSILGSVGGDAAATKIVELAKKLREVTAHYEAEKTKNKQLNKNCQDLETKYELLKDKKGHSKEQVNVDDDEDANEEKKINLAKENKELKERLNQTSHKMMEFKSQCEILKQDLKKTQKALEKEVGENVDVKAILAGQGNWKGRQQQIRMLQTKISELKQQVGMMDARSSQMLLDEEDLDESHFMKDGFRKMESAAQISTFSGFTSATTSFRTNLDSRHKGDLRKIEKDRKEQSEKMKREFEAIENDFNSMKEKFEAAKARNKVLTNENKTFKEQVKTLLEKGKHDDELIEALMKKQNQLKQLLESLNYQNDKASKEIEEKSKEAQIKTMQEKNTVDQYKTIVAEREKRVKQLEEEVAALKEHLNNQQQMNSQQFYIHNTDNDNSFSNESEFVRVRPPSSSVNSTANRARSDSVNEKEVREVSSASRNSIRNPKSRPASSTIATAAKIIENKKEVNIDYKLENNELKTLNKASEIERMRLTELAKTLQKRIEELNEKSMDSENRLNEQRRRCANLEKQLEKNKLQDSKNSANTKQKQVNANSSMDQYKIEELETSLLIQKDENDALKAALKSTLEAKEEDLRLYVEMLESTKRVFLDGLKQYKSMANEKYS